MSKAQILRYKTQPHAKPNLGKQLRPEWCNNISKGLKRYYSDHRVNNKGKPHTEATRKKMSRAMKRHWKEQKDNSFR